MRENDKQLTKGDLASAGFLFGVAQALINSALDAPSTGGFGAAHLFEVIKRVNDHHPNFTTDYGTMVARILNTYPPYVEHTPESDMDAAIESVRDDEDLAAQEAVNEALRG